MSTSYPTEWNLQLLIPDFSEQTISHEKKKIEEKTQAFIKKWKSNPRYLTEVKVLKEALDEFAIFEAQGGVGGNLVYAVGLYSTLDQVNAKRRALENQVDEFTRNLSNQLLFFSLSLTKIDKEHQRKFLAAPQLAPYHHYLKRTFEEGAHVLTEAEERLETLKAGVSQYKWTALTAGLLSEESRKVKGKERTLEELLSLLSDANKQTRDQAAQGVNDILMQYRKVAENEINALLENKKIEDELRSWSAPEAARLFADDISKEVVDTMAEVVASANTIAQEYYALKAKVLGQKTLQYHERNVTVAHTEKTYSYEDAFSLVKKVLTQLDQEFADIFEGFAKNGQIEVYPAKGKRGGAACWHNALEQPTYILLNFTERLRDVSTLAHEVGHGINNELIKQQQNALAFGTPTSTAEVASTFMEDFVFRELLEQATPEERLALLFSKLDDCISTIFRQVACYRFEQDLHQAFRTQGYLSAEEIGTLFQTHMQAYMGPAVEQPPESKNWWIYWSHIRMYFYVYSYASGLLISMALQAKVRENPEFITKVKEFLAAGMSASPHDIFLKTGINIEEKSFWHIGLAEVKQLLKEATELSRELNRN